MNKRYSEKIAASICRKLINHANKHTEITKYSWMDADGNQCYCDGYRAYRLRSPLEDMPVLPEDVKPVNLNFCFKDLDTGNITPIQEPDPDAVRKFVEENRHMHKGRNVYNGTPYDMGEGLPMVNPSYLLDALRLFPGATWYVLPDPVARLSNPIFIEHEAGTACICPIRDEEKLKAAKAAKELPTAKQPAPMPEWNTEPKYFIYAKFKGEKKYYLADLANGKYMIKAMYAPMYPESRLDEIKEKLDLCAGADLTASFQIRKTNGKSVIYTAVPTFTPELFAERVELSAMTPEQFAASHAA